VIHRLAYFSRLTVLSLLISAVGGLCAGEMRSVQADVAVMFDAPSAKAKKLYLLRKHTPLEVLVSVDGMCKVRDAEGSIGWVDKSLLGETRTVVVTAAQAEIRQSGLASASVLTTAEKWVSLDLLEQPVNGWIKIKHRDGAVGFVRMNQVWGL
jgi:SH3-like domain-containing protein